MYLHLAHLYDWPGSEDFSRAMLTRILPDLAAADLESGARILDLACGTGTLTIALARQGFGVTGLDISRPMLEIAQAKAAAEIPPIHIDWVQGDMRHFLLQPPFDAVLCLYDSLNHLLSVRELGDALAAIRQNLSPGGLFLFDMNTRANYDTFWQGKDVYEGPNYRLTTTTRFIPETGRAHVHYTAEQHTDDGLLVQEEEVVEQYFDELTVEELLKEHDFRNIASETFNPFAGESDDPEDALSAGLPLKTFWRCTR